MNNDRFKFRVWDKDKKIIRSVILFENIPTEHPRKPILTYWDHPCEKTAAIKGSVQRVWLEDCILMQCTGLKDDNGKLIFEGDIIKFGSRFESMSGVRFIEKNAGFLIKDKFNDWKWLYDVVYSTNNEIIGNIYENPELLEKK